MKNYLFISDSRDAWENLALDEWLLDHVGDDELVLYFYVNENAVIIGKNQNPWKECNLAKMEEDGVQLTRRVSGGGAVYHDGGNLNFSFNAGKNRYDTDKQFALILESVRKMGIPCEFSGRNDLTAEGKKFSGNAFCARRTNKQHHGTLLIHSDLARLSEYLRPDPRKIQSKGIDSVRSRVCNLSEFAPDLSVREMLKVIPDAFRAVYGAFEPFVLSEQDKTELKTYYEKHSSREWRVGNTPKFEIEIEERFPWGGVQMLLSLEKSVITEVQVFTDAMNAELPAEIESLLLGTHFGSEFMAQALEASPNAEPRELADFIRNIKL